jgi:hypothetical protein
LQYLGGDYQVEYQLTHPVEVFNLIEILWTLDCKVLFLISIRFNSQLPIRYLKRSHFLAQT